MSLIPSVWFGAFLLLVVPVYWLIPSKSRRYFLLAASIYFLGLSSWQVLLLISVLSVLTYYLGTNLYQRPRKSLLVFGIIANVGLLGFYKYTPLALDTVNYLANILKHPTMLKIPNITVPIGISFFTFKIIHYLITCYKKEVTPHSFSQFLLYITMFPIFTSGPIERWPHFEGQTPVFAPSSIYTGLGRIIIGLLKKKVLADNLIIFSSTLNAPGISSWGYWLAAYAYTLQIYFDFSGYSDIAIGSARLFGYEIMENFNWPYLKGNLSDFWKSWHMTLTGWFTKYIFIPLGGSRVSFPRILLNTMLVMAVTGLWHGAAWHFVVWGLYHGLGLVVWRIYRLLIGNNLPASVQSSRISHFASVFLTFHFVVVGWVLFSTELEQSLYVIGKMLLWY